jgi:hypothetical protein
MSLGHFSLMNILPSWFGASHVLGTGVILLGGMLLLPPLATGQTIGPAFAGNYSYSNLGAVSGIPASYGGLTVDPGDSNRLLISSTSGGGRVFSVQVFRNSGGHIVGFNGTPSQVSTAPSLDGGLSFSPAGVLFYTTWTTNSIGQIKPGGTSPARVDSLTGLGVSPTTGGLAFVPSGMIGAGQLRVSSYTSGGIYSVPLVADGNGTFTPGAATLLATLPGNPEGIAYVVGGSVGFTAHSLLVAENSTGNVAAYDLDASGAPLVGTRRVFLSGLNDIEGITRDPATGDYLLTTYSSTRVYVVNGFAAVPEPAACGLMAGLALCPLALLRRRRRQT